MAFGLSFVLSKLFGTRNDRLLRPCYALVEKVNSLEAEVKKLSDEQIGARRSEFCTGFEGEGFSYLEKVIPEAFAIVREASRRVLGMRHFDVQIAGGAVLNKGFIAEMKTGEGKTIVAILAAYLNSIPRKGVHVVTVNDYLAQRDAGLLGPLYEFLGVSVGCVVSGMDQEERKKAYASDVTYVTNNELVFDYLRDNMKTDPGDMVLVNNELHFAIIDEIDSILIDEARTPLIISGPLERSSDLYVLADGVARYLSDGDFSIDDKTRSIFLLDSGYAKVDEFLVSKGILKQGASVFGDSVATDEDVLTPEQYVQNAHVVHHVNQAIRAHYIFKKDVDYLVKNLQVLIVDEFTGRIASGRRYSDGLHQALEAKHGLAIQPESQTFASITYQNYFRMYDKLAGMTGTAMTEVNEFNEIYDLDVIAVPTNVPTQRVDEFDTVYKTSKSKYRAICDLVKDLNEKGQPVLIGTVSVGKSEELSAIFKKEKLKHNVLNAKYHEREAEIIADAGRSGAITIATNMAGRGTDIVLGGSLASRISEALAEKVGVSGDERASIVEAVEKVHMGESKKVKEAGGLYIIGSERHESRRIDNQLRGRSGRQGDPGMSKFFLALDDDLLRIFGGDKIDFVLSRVGLEDGEAIEHSFLNRVIAQAQKRIESYHFEIRKNLIKYDDIMNEQRVAVYSRRKQIVQNDNNYIIREIKDMLSSEVEFLLRDLDASDVEFESEFRGKMVVMSHVFLAPKLLDLDRLSFGSMADLRAKVLELVHESYDRLVCRGDDEISRHKRVLLYTLDVCWKEHLHEVDRVRSNASLKTYAQRDPVNEYKIEIFSAFQRMMDSYRSMSTGLLFRRD